MITTELSDIVKEFLLAKGKDTMHEFPRYLQFAIRGMKDMHFDVSGVPKVEVLDVDMGGRATLPEDIIRIIRMGFINPEGRFVEIFVDDTIVVNAEGKYSCETGENQLNSKEVSIPLFPTPESIANVSRNGQILGRRYGHVGGGVYSYRMDWARGVAEFSSNVNGQIILEYLSDPVKINGKYQVHPFLIEPIMTYMYWSSIRFLRSVSPQEKRIAHQDYLNQKHHARVRFVSESIGNMINASRKTISQTIKY